jgi:repressor LexA
MYAMVAAKTSPPIRFNALRQRREELSRQEGQRLTQEDIAARTGDAISQRTISHLEAGSIDLGSIAATRLSALARALKWSLEDLQGATGVDLGFDRAAASTPPYIPANVREIPEVILMPVYSLASAGMPMQDAEPLDYDPIAMPRDQWHPALMLFLAEGDSMSDGQEDSIRSGDILHVDMRDTDPNEGRVMVVQIPGQGVTVKRVRMLGGAYWLFSDNPDQRKYPPFQADEAKILGGVHELTRKVKVRLS